MLENREPRPHLDERLWNPTISRYMGLMQSQNPFLDEMAKLTQAAMGLAQAAGEEARSAVRAQSDKWAADLDLIRREEFEALKARIDALEARIEALSK